jgi:hypothetical protein
MANTKKISLFHSATGKTVYCLVRRAADGYRLNDADGAFAAAPADPYLSLAEDAIIKGLYEASESRTVWADGKYEIFVYEQAGGSPAPASDKMIGSGEMYITSDTEVTPQTPVTLSPTQMATGVLSSVITVTGSQITIIRGDEKLLTFNLGTAWNLTGKKAYFCAKTLPTADNSTAIVNRICTITDAINGGCEITLTATETAAIGKYFAEVEVRNTDESSPKTAMQFTLIIKQDGRQ